MVVVARVVDVATVGFCSSVVVVVSSASLGEAVADEEEEAECEESGALEDVDVVVVVVVVVVVGFVGFVESVDVEAGAEVDTGSGDDEPESCAGPRLFRTSLINPSLP